MVKTFCASGESEVFKGAVHAAAGLIAASMAAYNITAWHFRRERHLAANGAIYTMAVAWEMKQTLRHLRRYMTVPM
jgi:hypothetical protein